MKRRAWFIGLALVGCLAALGSAQVFGEEDAYVESVEIWHRGRIQELKKPDGWLSLAGLYWLEEGENSFGSDPSNRMVFPKGPGKMGSYLLQDGRVRVVIESGVEVLTDGHPLFEATLDPEEEEGGTTLSWGSLRWYVIRRDGRWAVRLKDEENPARGNFHGIERYPVDRRWRVEGRYEPYDPPRKLAVPNVTGVVSEEVCPGALVFEHEGRTVRLEPIQPEGEERLFLVFADATNGHGSYGGGRFLYVDRPDAEGRVVVDFNRCYNPPCAFTVFATCPRPPEANRLPFAVEAGERSYAH